jgi:hypothetical protein
VQSLGRHAEPGYSPVSTGFCRDTQSRFWRLANSLSSWSMMSSNTSRPGRYIQPSSRCALALEKFKDTLLAETDSRELMKTIGPDMVFSFYAFS